MKQYILFKSISLFMYLNMRNSECFQSGKTLANVLAVSEQNPNNFGEKQKWKGKNY